VFQESSNASTLPQNSMQFNTLMLSQGSGSSHQHHKSYQPWFSSPGAAIGAQSSAWSQPQSSHPSFEVPSKSYFILSGEFTRIMPMLRD